MENNGINNTDDIRKQFNNWLANSSDIKGYIDHVYVVSDIPNVHGIYPLKYIRNVTNE